MRCPGPHPRERFGEHRVRRRRGDDRLHIGRVRARLRGSKEARTHARGSASAREHRGQAASCRDAAGGDDRDTHGVENLREQREQARLSANVPARLGSLRDDEVAARALGSHGLRERPDLPAYQRAECASALDQLCVRIAVEELHDPRTVRSDREAFGIEKRNQEVDADDASRSLRELLQKRFEHRRRLERRPDHSQTARIRDRNNEIRSRDPRHRRDLNRKRCADEARERSSDHGTASLHGRLIDSRVATVPRPRTQRGARRRIVTFDVTIGPGIGSSGSRRDEPGPSQAASAPRGASAG